MQDWIDKYLQTKPNVHTRSAYRIDLDQLKKYLEVEFSETSSRQNLPVVKSWADVRFVHLQEFRFHLQKRGYQDSTLARKLAVLRTFSQYLINNGVIAVDQIGTIPSLAVVPNEPVDLAKEDVMRLLDAAGRLRTFNRERDCAVLTIVYYTGLRASDVTALTVDDVGPQAKSLRLPDETLKSFSDRPSLVLSRHMQKNHASLFKPESQTWPSPADAERLVPLFPNRQGTEMTRQGIWSILKTCLERSGLNPNINLQMLRSAHFRHDP